VAVIEAAGLGNLVNGVQLGPTVWYVKTSDAMNAARVALSADPVAVEPAQQEPVHWRAVLAADEVPMQLNPSLHVLGFRSLKAAEARVANEEDFNGWHYTIEPLTNHATATATIQALQEEVARLKPDAERWRALTWHWEDARDMGPGGRWWCSIMCDNEPATPAAAIDQARK